MSDLEGSLKVFQPIVVLQMLGLSQSTGELRLAVLRNSAGIFFERGSITFAEITNRPIRLGEHLVSRGLISANDLAQALKRQGSKRLGIRLMEAGVIKEDDLRAIIEEQIKEVIYEVVRWQDGRFTFTAGAKPKAQDIFIDIPLENLMLEGLKRLDEESQHAQ